MVKSGTGNNKTLVDSIAPFERMLAELSARFINLPADQVDDSGYIPTEYIIKLATDAGFRLAGQSEINANPKDTKDYEKGVWTLPPTLTLGEQDREKYLAIGESDRMTLKFVKPKADAIFQQGDGQPTEAAPAEPAGD